MGKIRKAILAEEGDGEGDGDGERKAGGGGCVWFRYDSYRSGTEVTVRKKGGAVHMCAFLRALWLGVAPERFARRPYRHSCGGARHSPTGTNRYRVCVRPDHVTVEGEGEEKASVEAEAEAEAGDGGRAGKKRKTRTWEYRSGLEKEREECMRETLDETLCEPDDPETVRCTGQNMAASKGRAYLKDARYGDTNIARILAPPRSILGVSRIEARKLIHEVRIRSSVLEETTPEALLLELPPAFDSLLVFTESNLEEMRQALTENGVPYQKDGGIDWGLIVEKRKAAAETLPLIGELPDFDAIVRDVEVVGASVEGFDQNSEDKGLLRYPFGGRETWKRVYEEARKEREETPRPPPKKRVRFAEKVEIFRWRK